MSLPIIGITLDSEDHSGYSDYPWYALRKNYCQAVINNGGIPITLPHSSVLVRHYIEMIDGIIITGGNFDIDPVYYGSKLTTEFSGFKDERTKFEYKLIEAALELQKPILGICGGEQLLNVVMGGSLIQHIPDEVPGALIHEQPKPKHIPWHDIEIKEDSLLYRITQKKTMKVNSTHHQAVNKLGKGVVATAHTSDGIVEAIEIMDYPFGLGVEWHPEYEVNKEDSQIFRALIDACRK